MHNDSFSDCLGVTDKILVIKQLIQHNRQDSKHQCTVEPVD